jgi:hypothetical protein
VKGRLVPEYWCECARCAVDTCTGAKRKDLARQRLRELGWRLTRAGWICDSCVEEEAEAKRTGVAAIDWSKA